MPRPLRLEDPGVYHVTQRGNNGSSIFLDDDDRAFFLSFLTRVVIRERWTCFAYCLMSNHYHAAIAITAPTLSRGMQWLNGIYARSFNGRHGQQGHVFGGRFRTGLIESEEHLHKACEYIELNPVRAGMCSDPNHWTWSSARARARLEPAPPFLDLGQTL
jgi:putative transposase